MALTTRDAFIQFKSKLTLTSDQGANVLNRAKSASGYAVQAFPSDCQAPHQSDKLIGSAARGTLIRPIDDIDLLLVLKNTDDVFEKYRHDSRQFIYWVRDRLNTHAKVQIVGTRGQAVRFFYKSAPHVDLAPVFKWSGAGYALPDGAGDWITTDPDAQDAYFNERAQVLGSNLKPLVRMIKRWNSVHSRHLKSFHLEVLVNQAFSSLGDNSRRACELFFEWAPNNLGVNDPAGHSGDLSQYLRLDSRQAIVNNLNSAKTRATQAIEAENRSDHREAIRLWRIVFGDEFPAYG